MIVFSNADQPDDSHGDQGRLVILAVVGGAFAGNFLWELLFKKRK